MAQVFISYSRQDTDFVRRMVDALKAHERDTWVDWEDIPLTANWWQEICAGIEGANTFLFVISPASLSSPVCNLEIAHAVQYHKRLVPIVRVPVDESEAFATLAARPPDETLKNTLAGRDILTLARDNWSALARHNWLFFSGEDQNEFDANFARLLDAIDTDLEYVHQHTRLLVRAREWEAHERNRSYLLSGDDLREAEIWQAGSADKDPQPNELQLAYLLASRGAANARSRTLLIGVSAALTVSLGLALLSFLLFGQSEERRVLADNNAQTATFALGEAEVRGTEVAAQATVAYENLLSSWDTQALFYASLARSQLDGGFVRPALLLAQEGMAHFAEGAWHAENHRVLLDAHNSPGLETAYMPHGDEVLGAAYSPDQTRLLSWSLDGTAGLWDAETGENIFTLRHQAGLVGAAWSADGSRVLTWAYDGVVTVWDALTGETISIGRHPYNLVGAAWSPDESRVISWANRTTGNAPAVDMAERQYAVTISDAATGETVGQIRPEWFLYPSYWLSNERVLTYVRGRLILWDANTGETIRDLSVEPENILFTSIGISPDKSQVAALDAGRNLRVWTLETGETYMIGRLEYEDTSVDNVLGFGLADFGLYLEWTDDDRLLIPVGHYLFLYDLAELDDTERERLLFVEDLAAEITAVNGFAPSLSGVLFNRAQDMILAWGGNFLSLWGTSEQPSIINAFIDATPTPSPEDPPADLGYASFAVETDYGISGAIWNADETRILTWSTASGRVDIWNTLGQRQFTLTVNSADPRINGAAWTPDETGILTWGTDGSVRRWQIAPASGLVASTEFTTMLGWLSTSADAPLYLSFRQGCPHDCALRVTNAGTNEIIRDHKLPDFTLDPSLKLNADGLVLATFNQGATLCDQPCTTRLYVWDANTGETTLDTTLDGRIFHTFWQPEGSHFILRYETPFDCERPCSQTVEVWDGLSGERVTHFESADRIQSFAWTDDGAAISVQTETEITIYDAVDGRIIETQTVPANLRAGLNQDELNAAYADYGGVSNLSTGELSPDGTRILLTNYPAPIGNTGVLLTVWDAETGELLWSLRHGNTIYDFAYTRDGSRLLTWSEDGMARIIEPENGTVLHVLQHRRAGGLGNFSRFSNPVWLAKWNRDDTRIMTASSDGTARVWDPASGQALLILEHAAAVRTAAWWDDESIILTTDDNDTTYIWDAVTGRLRLSLPGTMPIMSEDGAYVLTQGDARQSRGSRGFIWDLAPDSLLTAVETLEVRPFTNEERRAFFLPTFTPATPTEAPPDQRTPTPPTLTPLMTLTPLPTLTPSVTPTLSVTPTPTPTPTG